MTDVRTGLSFLPVSTTRHWRKRALGLVTGEPSAAVWGADHGLHVSSGVSVLPDRVKTSIRPPAGTVPRQLSVPQVATARASRGSDS